MSLQEDIDNLAESVKNIDSGLPTQIQVNILKKELSNLATIVSGLVYDFSAGTKTLKCHACGKPVSFRSGASKTKCTYCELPVSLLKSRREVILDYLRGHNIIYPYNVSEMLQVSPSIAAKLLKVLQGRGDIAVAKHRGSYKLIKSKEEG